MPDIEKNEQPVYALIQQIKDGTLNPKTLSKDARCRCVEVLLNEAYSPLEMAQLFKTCERTIKRDIEDILEARKMSPDLEQAKKIIGEFWMYARIHRDRLMKLARVKEVSVSERLQAEYMAFKVSSETIARLQSLGYLPSKPVAIVGDIFHHSGDSVSQLEELNLQIAELGRMADGDDEVARSVKVDVEAMKKLVDDLKQQTTDNSKESDHGKE
jgi:hypothetical protein